MNFFKNMINNWQFQNATRLYRVEPIVRTTECWENISKVVNMKKGKPLNFNDLEGMELYAKLVNVHEEKYWELYIKNSKKIDICYVRSMDLNILEVYRQ